MYFTHTSWRWNFCICGLDTSVCVNRLGWSPATTWLSPIPGDAIFNHRQSSSIITKPSVIFKEEDKETIIWNHLSFPFSSEPRYHSPSRSLQHNVLGVHMYVQHRDDGWHIITVTIINFRVTTHCHLQSSLLFHHSDWWKDQQQRRFVLFQVLWFQSYVLPFRRLFSFSRSLPRDETIINCRSKTLAIYNNRNNKQQQN